MQSRKLLDLPDYSAEMVIIKARIAKKGKRPDAHQDPQDNTMEDTLDPQQYFELNQLLIGSNSAAALRDRSMFTWQTSSVGRSDESRLLHVADVLPPRPVSCIGKSTP